MKLRIIAVLAIIGVATSFASAQWNDSMGRYTGPSPQFCYYAVDGVDSASGEPIAAGSFTIRNAGLNGIVESANNAVIGGDDFGMISVQISAREKSVQWALPIFSDNILWDTFNANFAPKISLNGSTTPDGQFLPIREYETVLWTMQPGLDASFFMVTGDICIETGYNLQDGVQGGYLFSVGDPIASGIFTIIGHAPEPSSLSLLSVALLAGLNMRRRTSRASKK